MLKKIILVLFIFLIFVGKTLAQGVDYYLPYPGILPDHPLYWLKMVRDRVSLIVTTNKTDKAEKMLLYADKRLGAAWALIDGNKPALGISTLTKAEKYLEQAVKAGADEEFKQKLAKAAVKHEEVIQRLRGQVEEAYVPYFDEMLLKLEGFRQLTGLAAVTQVSFEVAEETTVYTALEKLALERNWKIASKDYEFGKMVEAIAGTESNQENTWIYYVNGQAADRSADKFELKAGDKVEWKYEAVRP